jgi:hypothetical protein
MLPVKDLFRSFKSWHGRSKNGKIGVPFVVILAPSKGYFCMPN